VNIHDYCIHKNTNRNARISYNCLKASRMISSTFSMHPDES